MKEFCEQVAVVTGAASGIGKALAERFAAEGMKVVMADVEGPALDAAARELEDKGAPVLRAVIRDHSSTPIEGKLLGDGVLAVFTSARQAIEAALACGKAGDEAGLPFHLGLHAGDVIREDTPNKEATHGTRGSDHSGANLSAPEQAQPGVRHPFG